MGTDNIKSILVIGISGGLAQIVTGIISREYPNMKIIGVDSRSTEHFIKNKNMQYIQFRYTRNNFEKLFRNNKFDAVLHLGRMSHANANPRASLTKRLDLNVMGTNRILELSLKFKVKKIVLLSTFHVYGAYPDNPVFIKENSLLKASIKYPELRDVVEMDQITSSWLWKYQHEMETVLLRPCNIIGPQINNTMSNYFTTPYVPLPIDFNPMIQCIHEFDMANIIKESLFKFPTGVFNVTTNESISIKEAKRHVGQPVVPVPIFLLEQTAKFINKTMWSVPNYLIDYLKYPCILSNQEIKQYLPENFFRFSTREALDLIKLH